MKILLINGSPHEKGCTYTALSAVAEACRDAGAETEIFWLGRSPIRGCIGCAQCRNLSPRQCVFNDDPVNVVIEKARAADGFVFGSPVHYAAASGAITALLDRCFYSAAAEAFAYKPAACIVSARRGGTTAALDQLQKYVTINNMPLVNSQYWNMVHGVKPEDVLQDQEGMQTMNLLGKNLVWLIRCIEAGREQGITHPPAQVKIGTNFIR